MMTRIQKLAVAAAVVGTTASALALTLLWLVLTRPVALAQAIDGLR